LIVGHYERAPASLVDGVSRFCALPACPSGNSEASYKKGLMSTAPTRT
jgi:hypothetical protein